MYLSWPDVVMVATCFYYVLHGKGVIHGNALERAAIPEPDR